jgi:hypothetical protein
VHDTATKTECNTPYYEYTAGDCCLDSEPNQVCDRYENRTIAAKSPTLGPQAPKSSIVSDILTKFRQNITGYSYLLGKTKYLVYGPKARILLDKVTKLDRKINSTIPVYITDIYLDRETSTTVGYCDPRREVELMGPFELDRSNCAKLINTPIDLPYTQYNPVLPEDWLTRFEKYTPTLVEEAEQFVKDPSGWMTIKPVLHFIDNGDEYKLMLESKTGLPLKIEVQEGNLKKVVTHNWFVFNSVKPQEVEYQKFQK